MRDRDAFLRVIRANPDDDTARLVFADWLDEHDAVFDVLDTGLNDTLRRTAPGTSL